MISFPTSGQNTFWDSSYRPDIYPMMVEQFRAFRHSPKDWVFLGDSIIFWAFWNERLGDLPIKNRGIPGDITFGVLDRLDEVIGGYPARVFLLIGINDLARNIPDTMILANYERIMDRLREGSPNTKVYFQSLLPINPSFLVMTDYYSKKDHIPEINAALKKMALNKHIGYIDLYGHFVDSAGDLIREYTWDGVHLTNEGYRVWVELLHQEGYLKGGPR